MTGLRSSAPPELLPTAEDLPDGFVLEREGALKKAQMIVALGAGDAAELLLAEWMWRENAYRDFSIPGPRRNPIRTSRSPSR